MAPTTGPKRKPKENQYLFDLGVKGRKTGLTLPDTGIRDENGLEPMDHLFSSPAKPKTKSVKKVMATHDDINGTITSEEDMDVDESTIPEPTAVLGERKRANMRLPPRSKSPIKTFLQSPARRNPSIGPGSSPIRGSIVTARAVSTTAPVRRRLDFSNASFESDDATELNGSPQKRGAASLPPPGKLTNGTNLQKPFSSDNLQEDDDESMQEQPEPENLEDSFQMINGGGEEEEEEVEEDVPVVEQDDSQQHEPEPEPESKPQGARRGRPKTKKTEAIEIIAPAARKGRPKKMVSPVIVEENEPSELVAEGTETPEVPKSLKRKPGRPKRASPIEDMEQEQRPAKKTRKSNDMFESEPELGNKGGREKKSDQATLPAKAKPGRKPKLATITEADSPQIQRGPPLPRNNRGLFILRRETPTEGAGFKQTRSGRNSIKPLAYWKNERIEYSEDENEDNFGKFVLPRIKEVVRADEIDQPKRVRAKSKAPKSRKQTAEPESGPEDDDEVEPWEVESGIIIGNARKWNMEDPTGAQAQEAAEELALSSAAIITRDIAGATFRFAKTLTLPFFGSGMVDLPPGAAKKAKNSRKMQMVFFVFYGRVEVTVNDNVFRIGKGGMWQVPRGNFYSIRNDYEKPARIFFSQGCEVVVEAPEGATDSQ